MAGGNNAELYVGTSSGSCSTSTTLPQASINNSLLITTNPGSPHPRLFISNNDSSVKVFDVVINEEAVQPVLYPVGMMRVNTPINHSECIVLRGRSGSDGICTASISPDGKTLLAVGDTNEVFLYNVCGGESVSFKKISTYRGTSVS